MKLFLLLLPLLTGCGVDYQPPTAAPDAGPACKVGFFYCSLCNGCVINTCPACCQAPTCKLQH